MTGSWQAADGVLGRADQLRSRLVFRGETAAAVWRALAALLAVGASDAVFRWPSWTRGLALIAIVGVTYRHVLLAKRRGAGSAERPESTARALEIRLPDLDNALIHAVQFGAILERAPETAGANRMRLETARAETAASAIALTDVVQPPSLAWNRGALAVVVGFLLVTLLLFPRFYRFETPRILLFWQDRQAFTLTDFDISPLEAHISRGSGLTVTVRVSGQLPKNVALETGTAGEAAQTAPLIEADDGVYTTALTNIARDTWFRAVGDTGESSRGWARVDKPSASPPSPNAAPPKAGRKPEAGKPEQQSAKAKAELRRLHREKARVGRALRANAAARKRAAKGNPEAMARLQRAAQSLMKKADDLKKRIEAAQGASPESAPEPQAKPPSGGADGKSDNGSARGRSPGSAGDPAGGRSVSSGGVKKPTGKGRTQFAPKAGGDSAAQRAPETARPLSRGLDSAVSRAPAQYRDQVRDYFKAVAGGK